MGERIYKYEGLGNDFVLLDRRGEESGLPEVGPGYAVALCDRRLGVGADGLLCLRPSERAMAEMEVWNADGSRAQTCGNGLRCAALYLAESERAVRRELLLSTLAGLCRCGVEAGRPGDIGSVAVEMGCPSFAPASLPMASSASLIDGELLLGEERLLATALSMGNPHLVLWGIARARMAELGPRLEQHPLFPERVNVAFAWESEGAPGRELEVVVWERGCGLTRACGTGACAVAVSAVLQGRRAAGAPMSVRLPGGVLELRVAPGPGAVTMRGPARRVFDGRVAPLHTS